MLLPIIISCWRSFLQSDRVERRDKRDEYLKNDVCLAILLRCWLLTEVYARENVYD